jgi:hypothetical protein
VRLRWLREGDRDRTQLAFEMDSAYPGRTLAEIVGNVMAAAERFPQFRAKAETIIEHWDAHIERRRQQQPEPQPQSAAAGSGPDSGSGSEPASWSWALSWDPAPPMSLAEAMAFIADHPAPNAPPKYLAEIMDELLPCLIAAAQVEIHAVCDAWAAGPDEWRAAIARDCSSRSQ